MMPLKLKKCLLKVFYIIYILYILAFVAYIFSKLIGFYLGVTFVAKSPTSISDKTGICQFFLAHVTQEAFDVPISIHGFNNTSDNKFAAFATARCKKDMKVMLTVLTTFKFVKNSISKFLETLGAPM